MKIILMLFLIFTAGCRTVSVQSVSGKIAEAIDIEREEVKIYEQTEMIASSSQGEDKQWYLALSKRNRIDKTHTAGYRVAQAMKAEGYSQEQRRIKFKQLTAKYGLQSWIYSGSKLYGDLTVDELRSLSKIHNKPISVLMD